MNQSVTMVIVLRLLSALFPIQGSYCIYLGVFLGWGKKATSTTYVPSSPLFYSSSLQTTQHLPSLWSFETKQLRRHRPWLRRSFHSYWEIRTLSCLDAIFLFCVQAHLLSKRSSVLHLIRVTYFRGSLQVLLASKED